MPSDEQHARFHTSLTLLAQRIPHTDDREIARGALMWLAVARVPVRAGLLNLALKCQRSLSVEVCEAHIRDHETVADEESVAVLSHLVGDLMTTRTDSLGRVYVALSDPELPAYLEQLDESSGVAFLAFTAAQAHLNVLCICITIVTVTLFDIAHVHNGSASSSLVAYTWSSWSHHLALSGYRLDNAGLALLTDSMVNCLCTDTLVFLLALNDFATGPIGFPTSKDYLQSVALVERAQKSLEEPIRLLSRFTQRYGCAKELNAGRIIFASSRSHDDGSGEQQPLVSDVASKPRVSSQTETLRIDGYLKESVKWFNKAEYIMISDFAEIARSLRAVCVVFAEEPLYEELLKEFTDWSPMDVLVNAADFVEAVASYAYWDALPPGETTTPAFDISDPSDPNYYIAQVIKSKLWNPEAESRPALDTRSEVQRPATDKELSQFSPLRWKAASLIEGYKGSKAKMTRDSTFILNNIHGLSQRTTSFAAVPAGVSGGDPFQHATPLIPDVIRRFYKRRITPVFTWLGGSQLIASVDSFSGGAFTGGLAHVWPNIKAAMLVDGYGTAIVHLILAVILNHIRRMFVPWLGSYLYYHPIEDLRLSLSNPDVYLNQALSVGYTWITANQAQKYVTDLIGGLCIGFLNLNTGRWPDALVDPVRQANPLHGALFEKSMHLVKVCYLAWAFASAQYIFDRMASTSAFLIAAAKLLFGGDAEHIALGRLLRKHLFVLPTLGYQVYFYAQSVMWPLVWASVLCACVGQFGLLLATALFVGSVYAVLRYRARFYIALELSGLLVVLGFLALSAVLLGLELYDDPLGLRTSTARARRIGATAKAMLPPGGSTRTNVLRGLPAGPIMMPESWVKGNEERRGAAEASGGGQQQQVQEVVDVPPPQEEIGVALTSQDVVQNVDWHAKQE